MRRLFRAEFLRRHHYYKPQRHKEHKENLFNILFVAFVFFVVKNLLFRAHLLKLLESYQQEYPEEKPCVERYITFVTNNPHCFKRSLETGHVTGSVWIVNRAGTHTLLTHHKKLDKWLQPGGHADGNPNVLEVAIQEAQEESGINNFNVLSEGIFDLDIHLIPARKDVPAHYHYDARFVLQTVDSEDYQVSDESHDLVWIDIKKIEELTQEESMLRMARKWAVWG